MALLATAWLSVGCGKFYQARECGTFVKTVNQWLASAGPVSSIATSDNDAKQVAAQTRITAEHYAQLARTLAGLHLHAEELQPRVKRYQSIAEGAARTLHEVADSLERGELDQARKSRVDFDTLAQGEAPLVKEINELCR